MAKAIPAYWHWEKEEPTPAIIVNQSHMKLDLTRYRAHIDELCYSIRRNGPRLQGIYCHKTKPNFDEKDSVDDLKFFCETDAQGAVDSIATLKAFGDYLFFKMRPLEPTLCVILVYKQSDLDLLDPKGGYDAANYDPADIAYKTVWARYRFNANVYVPL